MNNWQEEYKRKMVSADEAASHVKSGDRVCFTPGREALAIGLAIASRKEELKGVRIFTASPSFDFGWYDEGWQDSFEVTVHMPTAVCQDAVDARRVQLSPGTLIPFEDAPDAPTPDVLLTEVSEPDERGFCSFGASVWNKRRVIKEAKGKGKIVIAEVNPSLIKTYGDNYVHVSEIDFFVEHLSLGGTPGTGTLAGRAVKETEPYLLKVAANVHELIKDGDTIQIGVGRTTEPLVKLGIFKGRKDIGWHSEATPGGVISLVREGVINGSRKTINPGKCVVTTLGGGTKDEMDWASMNPLFQLVDVGYLEDIRVIAAHDNMVAINNSLIIDLSGQIGSESIGKKFMGVAGGQIPFVYGATLSKGGRSITCMPSTAQNGKITRIVPTLPPNTVVTIQRNLADNVVTEYGIARLKGKTLQQRAQELINIAHPDHRAALKKAAESL